MARNEKKSSFTEKKGKMRNDLTQIESLNDYSFLSKTEMATNKKKLKQRKEYSMNVMRTVRHSTDQFKISLFMLLKDLNELNFVRPISGLI